MPALLSLFIALATAAAPATPRALDRLVAVVGEQPLFQSQLEFEARVAIISQGGTDAALAALGDEELGAALDYAVGQRLAYAEAERLQVFAPSEDDVRRALKTFADRFTSDRQYRAFLTNWEMSESQLAGLLRRDLRVTRYIESRIRLAARVSEQQARAWFNEHPADFANATYAEAREAIKANLGRERFRQLARKHLEELRARADVRMVAPFARSRAAQAAAADALSPDAGTPTAQP